MKGLSQSAHLLTFEKVGEWYVVEMGIGDTKSIPFEVPVPTIHSLMETQGEEALGHYLESQASAMIEAYGDGRNPRYDPALLEA